MTYVLILLIIIVAYLVAAASIQHFVWVRSGRVACPSCGGLVVPVYERKFDLSAEHNYTCPNCKHWASDDNQTKALEYFKGKY